MNNSILIVNHLDRICRYGLGVFRLILKVHNITLDVVNTQDVVSDENDLANDVLSIITFYTARVNGRKNKVNSEYHLSAECIELATNMKQSGYTTLGILKEIKKQGYLMENKRNSKSISLWVLSKYLSNGNGQLLEETFCENEDIELSSIEKFISECITITGQHNDKISFKAIKELYTTYCQVNEYAQEGIIAISQHLRKIKGLKRYVQRGQTMYRFITVKQLK